MMRKPSKILQKIAQDCKNLSQQGLKASLQLLDMLQDTPTMPAPMAKIHQGSAIERHASELEYQDVKQLLQQQIPSLTQQLLGARYQTVYKVSQWLMPNGFDKVLDQAVQRLDQTAQRLGATERVLKQMGEHQLSVLAQDLARSQRASSALSLQNQLLAQCQGALSGATGLFGAVLDLPASVLLALKTIYEIGHAYGFELDNEEDQAAVLQLLSRVDLGLIAKKHSVLLALRSMRQMLQAGDYQQIQSLLNSQHSFEPWQHYLQDQQGQYKAGLKQGFALFSRLGSLGPICAAGVAAYYNHQWIAQVATEAEDLFATARAYLNCHQTLQLSLAEAYELGVGMQPTISVCPQ